MVMDVSANYFPESVWKIYVINAPFVFRVSVYVFRARVCVGVGVCVCVCVLMLLILVPGIW